MGWICISLDWNGEGGNSDVSHGEGGYGDIGQGDAGNSIVSHGDVSHRIPFSDSGVNQKPSELAKDESNSSAFLESYYRIFEGSDHEGFASYLKGMRSVFIDIPIGLNEEEYHRRCDEELRRKLGPNYSSSVFSPPIRPVMDAPSYAEASFQSFEYTGKKLSIQSWNITPKIRQIDHLLQSEWELRGVVKESHPEWLFYQLNGGEIQQKKNTKMGVRHRLSLLSSLLPVAEELFTHLKESYNRNELAEDDIVDAMVLAVAAKKSLMNPVLTLPEVPDHDATGLVMAIHYL